MTNLNQTKKALISSVLALVLCFSTLLGTTFAWFTDSVTSSGNVIKTGTLDVEMYYADGKLAVPADNSADWVNADGKALYTANQLWEPGYTDAKHIKISNEGSLALKYQLAIVPTGEVSELAKVIDVYYIEDATQIATREDLATYTPIGTLDDLINNGIKRGNLSAYTDYTATLVLKMQENAGNEYKNLSIGNDFTIQLLATQYTSEEDSFDNTYDEDAWMNGMWVYSAEQLNAAIAEVEDGGTVILADDITFDKDSVTHNSGDYYDGVYYIGDKSFTINLNGKTITSDSSVNDYLLNFKNAGTKANTITIVNGTVEAPATAFCAICTSSTNEQKLTINLENVNLIGNNSNGSVVKIRGGAELNVKAGTVITGNNSYLGIENSNATVNIYDGVQIYQKGTSSYNGSLVGVGGNGTINVYGGYGEGVSGGFIAMTSGGTINVYGGEWIANTDGAYANSNKSVLIAQSADGAKSVINVMGGTLLGGYNCYGNAVGDAQLNISGGIFNNANVSNFVVDGLKAVENNGIYYVVDDGVDKVIVTASDLVAAFDNLQAGAVLYIAADLDMTGKTITPVTGNKGFTMYGNGYTISNLSTTAAALFVDHSGSSSYTFDSVVLENCSVNSSTNYGALFVGDGDTSDAITIKNCVVKNCNVTSAKYAAAFVAYTAGYNVVNNGPVYSDVLVEDCSVIGGSITGGGSVGAAIGHAGGNDDTTTTVTNLTVDGVAINGEDAVHTGVVVGTANVGDTIINNTTYSNVTGTYNGIYGRFVPGTTGTLVIDGATVLPAATTDALKEAVQSGTTEVYLPAGTYTMPASLNGGGVSLQGKTITIRGTKDTVIDATTISANDQFVTGATLEFDGVTLNFSNNLYMGFANTETLIYRNCHITGLQCLYGENVIFENCVIDSSANTGEPHAVWTYGAKNISFTDCDFIYGHRAINCYKDQDIEGGKQVVNFNNCTFTTTDANSEGAVEINSSAFSVGIEVNMEGCTAPAYGPIAYVSPWDSTNGAKTTINIK